MKVVESLVHYLIQRNLLSPEEKDRLQLKGFLDPYFGTENYPDSDDDPRLLADDPSESPELTSIDDEKEAGPRSGRRSKKPGAGPKLPELESLIRQSVPAIEENILRLKPLAEELGLLPTSSEWSRLFQEVSQENLRTAVKSALFSGTLPFGHLWHLLSEDCWQELVPVGLRSGDVWNAWRILIGSNDGEIPSRYRWILRSALVAMVYQQMQIQRKLFAALAALFQEEPDLLWRAVTRPFHEAGYLALSFAYTAALWRRHEMPLRSVYRTTFPGGKCFAADTQNRIACAGTTGGVWLYPGSGEEAKFLDRNNDRIEALAFHPSQDRLYISETDKTGENHVIELDIASRRERNLLQAFAWPEHFIVDSEDMVVAYKPLGVNGLRFFRRDVPGSHFLSIPQPIYEMDDICFLPGDKYVNVKVRHASGLVEDLIFEWSAGKIVKRFEGEPYKRTDIHRSKCALGFCTPEFSEIYGTSGLDLLAHDEQPFTLGYSWLLARFSSDGRWLAKWSAFEILVWDWSSGSKSVALEKSTAPGELYCLTFHQNFVAAFLVTKKGEHYHGQIDLWDLGTSKICRSVRCENLSNSTPLWFFFSDNGALMFVRSKNPLVENEQADPSEQGQRTGLAFLLEVWWPLGDGEKITFKFLKQEVPGKFIDCRLLPNTDVVLLRFRSGPAEIVLVECCLTLRKITSTRTVAVPPFRNINFYKDLDYGTGRELVWFDTLSGEKTCELRIQAHTNLVTSLKVADGGRFLLAHVHDQTLVRIDLAAGSLSGEATLPFAVAPKNILHVSSVPSAATTVLLASGNHLEIIEIRPEASRTRFEREIPGSAQIHDEISGTLSPRPQVAYGAGGQLEMIDLPDTHSNPIFLHPIDDGGDWVTAFSPCGRFLSAIRKGEFRMWTSSGQPLHRRLFSCEQPSSVQYSPDGQSIWIWDQPGTLWKICVSSLEVSLGARIPVLDLPDRETALRAWTVAQKMTAIEAGDWVPLLAAVCSESGDSSRFTYGDLGLRTPVNWVGR